MTDPYGALAMLCFALTHTHPIRNTCRTLACCMNARLNSRFLSPFVFHIFYFLIFPLDSLGPLPLSFMFRCTLLDL